MKAPEFLTKWLDGFPEYEFLQQLADRAASKGARVHEMGRVTAGTRGDFNLVSVVLGSKDPTAPSVGFFGGVHGVERIGSQVVLAWLHTLLELLEWDEHLNELLKNIRIVFMPLVNPTGMITGHRCNFRGVDLMRNAPVEAEGVSPWMLLAGQRFSARLPWYRGVAGSEMEPEAAALVNLVQTELYPSRSALSVDVHSGFGVVDRLWFPWARTREPLPDLPQVMALVQQFELAYPNHAYDIEPQARQYRTHGDLWDFLYETHRRKEEGKFYLPFCLELGSWLWVKKSPLDAIARLDVFNPLKPHRLQRILRAHLVLFDFLLRAARSDAQWAKPQASEELREQGRLRWYA